MFDPENVQIAVALVKLDQKQIAMTWNDNWESFVLPMTKISAVVPVENPEQAAVRAAAEVLHLPMRVVPGQAGKQMRKLQLSNRNGEIKDYHFTVVPIEVHPDFRNVSLDHQSVIFMPSAKLHDGEYQPQSPSVKPILDACAEWGWL